MGGEREKKRGAAITDSHRLSRERKNVSNLGLLDNVLVRGKWTGVDDDLHAVVYHANKTPQGQMNATNPCALYSRALVLSKPLYNVLCATYQASLMYNVQYMGSCLRAFKPEGMVPPPFCEAKHIVHTAHALAPQFNTLVEDRRARVLRNAPEPILLGFRTQSLWSWNLCVAEQ